MEKELDALQAALGEPVKPVAAVVGGAKVSTKLDVLNNLVAKVDHLIIGGGMANRSEEHTSELQSLMRISYAVFCLQQTIMSNSYPVSCVNKTNNTGIMIRDNH